jgi:hypothetical protein
MNKLLLSLTFGFTALGALAAQGTVERSAVLSNPTAAREAVSGVKLSDHMLRKLPAAALGEVTTTTSALNSMSLNRTVPHHKAAAKSPVMRMLSKEARKAASKASSIQAYTIYAGITGSKGWYNVTPTSATLQWAQSSTYTPNCGFVRGDEIIAFYTYNVYGVGLTDAGVMTLDKSSGSQLSTTSFPLFDSVAQVVLAAAYDEETDEAYVITYNDSGTSYQLQKYNPATSTFTNLGVTVPDSWLNIGWNPEDKMLYMFDEDCNLKKFDANKKSFTLVGTIDYEVDEYPHDMVYSPKDGAFVMTVDSYDSDDDECTDMLLLYANATYTYLGTNSNNYQYGILAVPDKYTNANAPKAPTLKSWNVSGAATTGNFVVTLPTTTENGTDLSGTVYLEVTLDGATVSGSYRGTVGSDVTIAVNADEGLHRYSVKPYVLTDDGKLYGSTLVVERYLGYDAPAAPTDVVLTQTSVTWSAVTEGANGGYVDPSAITYNVYIDGELMNTTPVSGTSLAITIPQNSTVGHRASVVAIANNKTSEAGVSAKFYAEGALNLPVYLGADEGQTDLDKELINMFTIVKDKMNTNSYRGWRYDDQKGTGGFYCLCPSTSTDGDIADEWLFLPAINFPDANGYYHLGMEIRSGDDAFHNTERYEVALCKQASSRGATIIKEASDVATKGYFEYAESYFQVPAAGTYYIGIHYVSPIGTYRLYARNFEITTSAASATSPAAVDNLMATGAERGELAANLTFKMPKVDISGNTLDASTVITATAVTDAGSASTTGAPGEAVTLKVPALQGDNVVRVTTSSTGGEGQSTDVQVYCGVYTPASPVVECLVSDDNQKMTLNFFLEDYNEDGQYTGPDSQTITIYRQVNGEWKAADEIGTDRTWTFDCPDPGTQDLYQFGVAARNAVGYCETMTTVGVHLGKLYSLPMNETFDGSDDESVNMHYEPLTTESISYYPATWGFCDPSDADESAANDSGVAIYATWEAETQLLLPRFTTANSTNAKLDLGLFFGTITPDMITVYATSPSIEMEPVATFTRNSGSGWEHKLVSLPASCQGQGWVQITIRVKMTGYAQYFLLESYAVADYPDEMATISSMKGNTRGAVGDTLTYSVEVENAGVQTCNFPEYTFTVNGADGTTTNIVADNVPATLASGKKATLNFNYVAKSTDLGEISAEFRLLNQPSESVSAAEQSTTIINALVPVIDDLSATTDDSSNVTLSWTTPSYVESFEAFEPFDYSEEMRGFRNIDMDGAKEWAMGEVNFIGEGEAKAFQVFTSTISTYAGFAAHSGEQYLLTISPKSGTASDWLISPEVTGGSTLSFWMRAFSSDYPETILVMTSSTTNDVEAFTQLATGYICMDSEYWTKYTFELPADTKYFALQYAGDDGANQFGVMIDDLAYEPANGAFAVEGYNIYRDNVLIASNVNATDYVDSNVDLSSPVRYFVKAIATVNGEKLESDRSNVVWAGDESGVENLQAASATITATKGMVHLEGFAGSAYTISTPAGVVVASAVIDADRVSVPVSAGVYVVKCGTTVAKLVVK